MILGYSEHPDATDERLDAIRYYHGERAGLGDDLAGNISVALREVVGSPDSWPPVPDWNGEPLIRSKKVRVYPYRVVYYVRDEEVVIVAYAHERRRPGYWAGRLDG